MLGNRMKSHSLRMFTKWGHDGVLKKIEYGAYDTTTTTRAETPTEEPCKYVMKSHQNLELNERLTDMHTFEFRFLTTIEPDESYRFVLHSGVEVGITNVTKIGANGIYDVYDCIGVMDG